MKFISHMATLGAALALPCLAGAQTATEHTTIHMQMEYAITTARDQMIADTLGLPMTGEIEAKLFFPLPECIVQDGPNGRVYAAESLLLAAFDQELPASSIQNSWMVVTDNFTGYDRLQFSMFVDAPVMRDEIRAVIFQSGFLPEDALDDNTFVSDAGLLEDIWNAPNMLAYIQLASAPGYVGMRFQATNVEVSVDRQSPSEPMANTDCRK